MLLSSAPIVRRTAGAACRLPGTDTRFARAALWSRWHPRVHRARLREPRKQLRCGPPRSRRESGAAHRDVDSGLATSGEARASPGVGSAPSCSRPPSKRPAGPRAPPGRAAAGRRPRARIRERRTRASGRVSGRLRDRARRRVWKRMGRLPPRARARGRCAPAPVPTLAHRSSVHGAHSSRPARGRSAGRRCGAGRWDPLRKSVLAFPPTTAGTA